MSDRDHAIRELAALLEADLMVSGAKTRAEMHAALKDSILSLMSEPQIEAVLWSKCTKGADGDPL